MDHAVICYVHPDYVRAEFTESMLALTAKGRTLIDAILACKSGPNISRSRNAITRRFMEEQTAPWLLMVDTDMVFTFDALDRLIAAADPKTRPIVGGLCFKQTEDGEQSTMMELVTDKDGRATFAAYLQWPEDTTVQVSGTGTAFLLMHRTALDKVARHKPDPVYPWFREVPLGGKPMGEDLTFCLRAGAAGVPIHVHTGIQVGHMKSIMLGKVA